MLHSHERFIRIAKGENRRVWPDSNATRDLKKVPRVVPGHIHYAKLSQFSPDGIFAKHGE